MRYLILLLLFLSMNSYAATTASISYLYGTGYVNDDKERNTYRVDVTNTGKYHLLFARTDVSSFNSDASSINTRLIGHLGSNLHLSAQHQNANKASIAAMGYWVHTQISRHYCFCRCECNQY